LGFIVFISKFSLQPKKNAETFTIGVIGQMLAARKGLAGGVEGDLGFWEQGTKSPIIKKLKVATLLQRRTQKP
jgi:hypothetical protein